MDEKNDTTEFASLFEAIQNTPDAEAGLAMMAIQILGEDLARLELGLKSRPAYASLLVHMKSNLDAIQWFVEGVQDAQELAMAKPDPQK